MIVYLDASALVKHYVAERGSSEALVSRAETVAWDYGLRGYDAVQLASALTWRDSVGQDVVLGTFDGQLWEAAPGAGLHVWPEKLRK